MAVTMMLLSAVISIVFLVDFTKTIRELKREHVAVRDQRTLQGPFGV